VTSGDRDIPGLLGRIERFYDAVPRDVATAEEIGGLVLFVRQGAGWPFYARPRPGADEPPSAADIIAVRERQRDLGVPEALEWVHEVHPDLLAVARSAGLAVREAPLMVLDTASPPEPAPPAGVTVRLLDPAAPSFAEDVAARRAVTTVAFGAPAEPETPGTVGSTAPRPLAPDDLEFERRRAAAGRIVSALAEDASSALAAGVLQQVDDVAEVAGVGTVPSARRRGLGGAVTAALARHALDTGVDVVLLSAGSDDVARTYARVGFRRIGTACVAGPAPVVL
jgi:ribosomal protein S18 acetylase RimI-like enzyme